MNNILEKIWKEINISKLSSDLLEENERKIWKNIYLEDKRFYEFK